MYTSLSPTCLTEKIHNNVKKNTKRSSVHSSVTDLSEGKNHKQREKIQNSHLYTTQSPTCLRGKNTKNNVKNNKAVICTHLCHHPV